MKSASDEEVEKLLEAISRRISIFVYKVESAGRDFEKKIEMSQEIKLPKAFQISNPLVDFI